jgi:hypothetical protein
MRTPRVSAHPDFGQIAPLYPYPPDFVCHFPQNFERGLVGKDESPEPIGPRLSTK